MTNDTSLQRYTPGRWEYSLTGTGAHVITVEQGEIAEAFGEAVSDDEARANGLLIAAAPLLREALERILPFAEELESRHPSCDRAHHLELLDANMYAQAAIAKARGAACELTPADRGTRPEEKPFNALSSAEQNIRRSHWAGACIAKFIKLTGCDYEDSLGDLLCNLIHWARFNNFDFECALIRAGGHYRAELLEETL